MKEIITTLKEGMVNVLPPKISGVEIDLSPGESLLLTLEAAKRTHLEPSVIERLRSLYLEGVKTPDEQAFILEIANLLSESGYKVKFDPQTINEDPSRRYFETSLAFHLLQNKAESLDTEELKAFQANLKQRLFSLPTKHPDYQEKIEQVLSGNIHPIILSKYEEEYAQLTHQLLKNNFHGLSEAACKNLYEIACSTFLATCNTQMDKSMPVDIYKDSVFTMGPDGRGRIVKGNNDWVHTTAKGLMKSTSPLPLYHDLVNPIESAYIGKEVKFLQQSPFQRSADQANFMLESSWSQLLLSRLTQVYSNGISSTTLAQLRNIILQMRLGNAHFSECLEDYLTVFSALMVYNSGGHSFFEIFEVFKLNSMKDLINLDPTLSAALESDSLMTQVLMKDNQSAFDHAIQSTLTYLKIRIAKKRMHAQLDEEINGVTPNDTIKTASITLHEAVCDLTIDDFKKLIAATDKTKPNLRNEKGWTALMVAAQLGKKEHVQALLDIGADINAENNNLSALELAVKYCHADTVKLLFERGAKCKIFWRPFSSIAVSNPTLYLACRQDNTDVIKICLEHSPRTRKTYLAAMETALEVENTQGLRAIMDHYKKEMAAKDRSSLLEEAIKSGNLQLIELLINYKKINRECINYRGVLLNAATHGYFPVVKMILSSLSTNQSSETRKNLNDNLNKALNKAIEHQHFSTALLLIMYGADPLVIKARSPLFQKFESYLNQGQLPKMIFTVEDLWLINRRVTALQSLAENPSKWQSFIINLVNAINKILPEKKQFNYARKFSLATNISTMFNRRPCFNQFELAAQNPNRNAKKEVCR